MKKYPKYIVMPVALLLYFLAMAVYGYKNNGNKLPDNFAVIVLVEALILVILFLVMRYQHRNRS